MTIETYLKLADLQKEELTAMRRDFHRYAESGWNEFRTTSVVIKRLRELGYEVRCGRSVFNSAYVRQYPAEQIPEIEKRAISQGADPALVKEMDGYTGAVATLDTGKPGPVLAFRFDIDANEVSECSEESHRPCREGFSSVNSGMMHACGHDGHCSIGLGTAAVLMRMKDDLCGKIRLIFQPGEEGARGGRAMAMSGIVDDVDVFLAAHLGMGVPSGTLVALTNGFLSSTKFDASIRGTSAHAAMSPECGHNALLAAASASLAMYSLCQDSRGATRLNIGTLSAGEGRNIVAHQAFLRLETRGETSEIEERLFNGACACLKGSAAMYGCESEIEVKATNASGHSSVELKEPLVRAAKRVPEFTQIIGTKTFTACEDATDFMNRVQERGGLAAYVTIGADIAQPHHNVRFDFDENALVAGVKFYLSAAWEFAGIPSEKENTES